MEQKPTQVSSCVRGEFCGPTAGKQSRVSRYHTLHLFFLWGSRLLISASLDESLASLYFLLQSGFLCVIIGRRTATNGCCQFHVYTMSQLYYPSPYHQFHSMTARILRRENVTAHPPTDGRPPLSSRARLHRVSGSL